MKYVRPGELVNQRYEILGALGSGGMGEILLARQLNLDRLVVLKRAIHEHSERDLRALADEARVAAQLHHPNIVSILDVVDAEGNPVVVLELVVGVSLGDVIRRAPEGLPVDVAIAIAIDVLRGLAYAHSVRNGDRVGVVHRDVKPRNVMVTFAGVTKLIDFGISHWLDAHAPGRSIAGTKGYMAPEQARGEVVDGRSDQYAVGVTLGEMITGTAAFDTLTEHAPATEPGTPTALGFATTSSAVVPSELSAIIARACARRPADRYADCGELITALEAYSAAHGLQASSMQVERWMGRHFADHKLGLERQAQVQPRRSRPPTSPTVALGPPRHRRLAFSARNAGEPGDAWLAPVIERMVRRTLHDREVRRFRTDRGENAMAIELVYTRADDQLRIDACTRTGEPAIASAVASSVAGAARSLADALDAGLGAGLEPLAPDPQELDAMRRVGATSIPLFRRYDAVVRSHFETILPDTCDEAAAARALIACDPDWARPYALLSLLEGVTTTNGREACAAGRATASAARDPSGMNLLRAIELRAAGDLDAAFELVDDVFRDNDTDLVAGQLLMWCAYVLHRFEDTNAVARRLHVLYPELMFGHDVAECSGSEGRPADGEHLVRAWVTAAPESVGARVELTRIEAHAGRLDEARARAREAVVIHRDRDAALPDLFEALVESEQIADARAIADRMLVGSPLSRARGRYRVAVTSVFQGRFASAYNAVRRATTEHRAFGFQSELVQCLELARKLAPLVAGPEAQRRHTEELACEMATLLRDAGAAAATRFELAMLDGGAPHPSIEAHLADLPEGPMRDVAHRRMLRAAAVAGRGSPHEAVAAGFSPFEDNTASLVAFGLCAWRVRELALARQSLERASRMWSAAVSPQHSPYDAILARFHLAGVRAELGDHAGARAACAAFLRCWSDPDRPVPEVAIARHMLEPPR